jgi:hypothetical protein
MRIPALLVSASAVVIVISACSSSSSGGPAPAADAGGGNTTDAGGGGGGFDADLTPGKCNSELKPNESCPSPCMEQSVDGKQMCLAVCSKDADCTDSKYNHCYIAINSCTPSCAINSDCTMYGFNICLNAHDCE